MTVTATSSTLVLCYCDLLGDYLIFRHVLAAALPLMAKRFQSIYWVCHPGVAALCQALDPDFLNAITLVPVPHADWMRLTFKRLPKFWLRQGVIKNEMRRNGIPLRATQLWCPSIAPFEDNAINLLIRAKRKIGRSLESAHLDLMQRLVFDERLEISDYKEFILLQHVRFFEHALNSPLPALNPQPIQSLPAACTAFDVPDTSYGVIFPESAGTYKEWPPEAFAQLIQGLLATYPGWSWMLAGQRTDVAQQILTGMPADARVINAIGQTTVLETLGLIQHSHLVICNDSFPLHAANALAKPVVCITSGQFEGRYYPYPDFCRFSQHHFVYPDKPGELVAAIQVDKVLQQCLQVMAKG